MNRRAYFLIPLIPLVFAATPAIAQPSHIDMGLEDVLNEGLGDVPKGLDRTTPRRAWKAFLTYCEKDQFADAAHLMNLKAYDAKTHKEKGAVNATKLYRVLTKLEQLSADDLTDNPVGPIVGDQPTNFVVAAKITGYEDDIKEVWLQRTRNVKGDEEVWVVSPTSISAIAAWYDAIVEKKEVVAAVEIVNEGLGKIPEDFTLDTPRAAAKLFRKLANEGKYADAARLLDLSSLAKEEQAKRGQRLARRLALLLQRLIPERLDHLSKKKNGADETGIPSDQDVVAQSEIDGVEVDLRLQRVRRQGTSPAWIFSADTVGDVDSLYRKIGYGWAGDYLPTVFFRVQLWSIQLWQAIGLLVGVLLGWLFGLLGSMLMRRWLMWVVRKSKNEWDDALVEATRGPMALLLFALGLLIVASFLALAQGPQSVVYRGLKLLCIWGVGWYLVRVVDVAADILMNIFRSREDDMGLAMVPVARRIFRPLLIALVFLLGLQNIGLNVAGLLAGLGIGGLALAMASKSTVENMLGGITIAIDRPFTVGDTIKAGGFRGSVEEVGLRSTRIRTSERTLVTIPNGKLADSHIENFAVRDKLRHSFTLGLQYDTSMDQVRLVIDEVKRYLYQRGDVGDGFSVRLSELGDSSVNVQVVYYHTTDQWGEFTAWREEVLMEATQIVARVGAELAFPSQTIYTGKASDADGEKADAAAKEVEKRKADGTLCIPEIPEKVSEALDSKKAASA